MLAGLAVVAPILIAGLGVSGAARSVAGAYEARDRNGLGLDLLYLLDDGRSAFLGESCANVVDPARWQMVDAKRLRIHTEHGRPFEARLRSESKPSFSLEMVSAGEVTTDRTPVGVYDRLPPERVERSCLDAVEDVDAPQPEARSIPNRAAAAALAAELAAELANDACEREHGIRPFMPNAWPMRIEHGRWVWGAFDAAGPAGHSAVVSFEADGMWPKVRLFWMQPDDSTYLEGFNSTALRGGSLRP